MKNAVSTIFFSSLILISSVSLAFYFAQDKTAYPTNLIANGSFESHAPLENGGSGMFDNIEGWTTEEGQIELQSGKTGGIAAHEGSTKIELDAYENSAIFQNIETVDEGRYGLTLYYAPRVRQQGTDTNDIELFWDGLLFDTLYGDDRAWQHRYYDLQASSNQSELKLKGAGLSDGLGGLIDDIKLFETPYTSENLIVNGSFETHGELNDRKRGAFVEIEGWQALIDEIEIHQYRTSSIFAQEGIAKIELDADENAEVMQEIHTLQDARYELSLFYTPRIKRAGTDTNDMQIYWDG